MGEGELIADLSPTGILTYVSPEHLEALKFYGLFGEYGVGENVVQQDVEQDRLYVVVSGQLEVFLSSCGKEMKIGDMGPGDCIGEVSIFEPGVASATVRVTETAVLWSLDVQALQQFFEAVPLAAGQLLLGISQLLSRRLRHANQSIIENSIMPQHLGVRCGMVQGPIKFENLEKSDKSSGIFGSLLGGGGKKDAPKFVPKVRR